ncbi:hypothetical protein HPP92_027842 [Vanilla planifolia]|uniref:Uncharacterized protein n=1 Tax=Vanilla planifolia TaxID=51239 RepID=A0A835U4V0_VANPL|nr:hypothetical protein HPP92_027842 [Vanilla planifolia]
MVGASWPREAWSLATFCARLMGLEFVHLRMWRSLADGLGSLGPTLCAVWKDTENWQSRGHFLAHVVQVRWGVAVTNIIGTHHPCQARTLCSWRLWKFRQAHDLTGPLQISTLLPGEPSPVGRVAICVCHVGILFGKGAS